MGVLGLNPFLQKVCPHVFKSFPNRFGDFRGKRIVFDGTLITQRLHFAPSPHPHRHILGWYRIIQELHESSVTAICVFDGKSRNAAKQAEVARRRETRRALATRGFLEKQRFERLQKLQPLVQALNGLTGEAKLAVTQKIRSDLQEASRVTEAAQRSQQSSTELYAMLEDSLPSPSAHFSNQQQSPSTYVHTNGNPHDTEPPEEEIDDDGDRGIVMNLSRNGTIEGQGGPETPTTRHSGPDSRNDQAAENTSILVEQQNAANINTPVDAKDGHPIEPSPVQQTEFSVGSVKRVLTYLYTAFKNTFGRLASTSGPDSISPPVSSDEVEESRVYNTISKAQQELTDAEGVFWHHLCEVESVPPDAVESAAYSLLQKSAILVESYERRTQIPTAITYDESKEILQAMGVPCIETDGPYEAEAVAAAMVLQGEADYVASEDTDVLVYGAPLIRGTTTRAEPLITVSGADICQSLQLDQAQFIDFALLLGTDFSQRIKNIGPNRALKFIREHGTIERIVERETQYPPRLPILPYLEQVAVARLVFQTLPPVSAHDLTPLPVDETAINAVMNKYNLWKALADEQQSADGLSLNGNYFNDRSLLL